MPTSDPRAIPFVLFLMQQARAKSVLDVGCGHGKMGVLAREYLDLTGPTGKLQRNLLLDAVEVFPNYLGPLHAAVYDHVYVGDVRELRTVEEYDLVLMADVLEHLPRLDGGALLQRCAQYIVTTPATEFPQGAVYGNEHERHVSLWAPEDFPHSEIVGNILVGYKLRTFPR